MNSFTPIYPAEIRRRAYANVRAHFFQVMLVTLIASLPSLALQLAVTLSQNKLVDALQYYQYADFSMAVLRRILLAVDASLPQVARLLWRAIPFLFLMLPFLNIGRMYVHLRFLRGEEADVKDVFSRAGCFLKAIVLEILTVLKVVLWSLPGVAVMFGGSYLLVTGGSEGTFSFLYTLGAGLMIVLGVRANLHYTLAPVIMADHPEKGTFTCLKESIALMRKQIMPLLSLLMSFILYMLLEDLAVNLVAALSYSIALTLNVLLSLFFSSWMNTSVCAYYETRMQGKMQSVFEENTELN